VSDTDHRSDTLQRPPIVLRAEDRERLSKLLSSSPEQESIAARFLREELDRADITRGHVAAASLVTMGSEVKFIDHDSLCVQRLRLVYPDQANDLHCISVLTPIGSALIGLGPGQSISVVEDGIEHRFTVLEVCLASK
jgi:regulator of nucleoside diphosphate kinase